MQRTITLDQALTVWYNRMKQNAVLGDHTSDFELAQIAEGKAVGNNDVLDHLLYCDECAQKYKDFVRGEKQPFAELAWKKAAASEKISWPQFLYSDNGTFKIEIRKSEENSNIGLISVEAVKKADQLEGREIIVIDGKSRKLLQGPIRNGQIFQKVDKLSEIDLRLLVRTLD